jgi:hypothetical protein
VVAVTPGTVGRVVAGRVVVVPGTGFVVVGDVLADAPGFVVEDDPPGTDVDDEAGFPVVVEVCEGVSPLCGEELADAPQAAAPRPRTRTRADLLNLPDMGPLKV